MRRSQNAHGFNDHFQNENSQNGGDSHMLSDENESLTKELRTKVKSLKSMTIEIGEEIRGQNKFVDEMDDTFFKSGNLLERTMKRLGIISKGSQNYHTLILFAFCFFVFFLLWLILKFK